MKQLASSNIPENPPNDGSAFMRPFAIGMSAYLACYQFLYVITRGAFHSPDAVSDVYFFVLAAYAGAPEIKRWRQNDPSDPDDWQERLRKGGPLITLWFMLWAAVVLLRIKDASYPMPAELKTILIQVMTLFFGAYALRQARKRSIGIRSFGKSSATDPMPPTGSLSPSSQQILDFMRNHSGSTTPSELREALQMPRSSVSRALSQLAEAGLITRDAANTNDPNPRYRLGEKT